MPLFAEILDSPTAMRTIGSGDAGAFGLARLPSRSLATRRGFFSDAAGAKMPPASVSMRSGETLTVGQRKVNGGTILNVNPNGDVMLMSNGKPAWHSGTQGNRNVRLTMMPDGELVIWSADNKPLWSAHRNISEGRSLNPRGSYLEIGNDGNMVIRHPTTLERSGAGQALWSSRQANYDGQPSWADKAMSSIGEVVQSKFFKDAVNFVGAPLRLAALPATAIAAGVRGENMLKFVGREAARQGKALKTGAEIVAQYGGNIPIVGQGLAAACGTGLALADGKPLSEAAVAGIASALPGGPVAQAAFKAGLTAIAAVARGERFDKALLEGARAALPSDLAKKAFDVGIGVAEGKRIQDLALAQVGTIAGALGPAVGELAGKVMQSPALKALDPAKLAAQLGVSPDLASKALDVVSQATKAAKLSSITALASSPAAAAAAKAAMAGVQQALPAVSDALKMVERAGVAKGDVMNAATQIAQGNTPAALESLAKQYGPDLAAQAVPQLAQAQEQAKAYGVGAEEALAAVEQGADPSAVATAVAGRIGGFGAQAMQAAETMAPSIAKAGQLVDQYGQAAVEAIAMGRPTDGNPVGLAIAQLTPQAQSVAQTILADPTLRGRPANEVAQKLGVGVPEVQTAIGAIVSGVRHVANGRQDTPPNDLIASIASQILAGSSLDSALGALASNVAPATTNAAPNYDAQGFHARVRQRLSPTPPSLHAAILRARAHLATDAGRGHMAFGSSSTNDAGAIRDHLYGQCLGFAFTNHEAGKMSNTSMVHPAMTALRQKDPALYKLFLAHWSHCDGSPVGKEQRARRRSQLLALYPQYGSAFQVAYRQFWPGASSAVKSALQKCPLPPLPTRTQTPAVVARSLNMFQKRMGANLPSSINVLRESLLGGAHGLTDDAGSPYAFMKQGHHAHHGNVMDRRAMGLPKHLKVRGPWFSRTMASGIDAGAGTTDVREVADAQSKLKDLGYNLVVDGVWGPKTSGAVKDFQSRNGLVADGIYGEQTKMVLATVWNARAAAAGVPIGPPAPPGMNVSPTPGQPDPTLSDVQKKLNDLGFGPLERDGLMGPATKAAVMKFQKVNGGLAVDGVPGPNTRTALEKAWLNRTITKPPTSPGAPPSAPSPSPTKPADAPPAVIAPSAPQLPDVPRAVTPPPGAPPNSPPAPVPPPQPLTPPPPVVVVTPSGPVVVPQPTPPVPPPFMGQPDLPPAKRPRDLPPPQGALPSLPAPTPAVAPSSDSGGSNTGLMVAGAAAVALLLMTMSGKGGRKAA